MKLLLSLLANKLSLPLTAAVAAASLQFGCDLAQTSRAYNNQQYYSKCEWNWLYVCMCGRYPSHRCHHPLRTKENTELVNNFTEFLRVFLPFFKHWPHKLKHSLMQTVMLNPHLLPFTLQTVRSTGWKEPF